VFPIGAGYAQGSSGGPEARRYPVAAMVANLAKPKPGQAALMLHDDVVTFFHEMGHVFHGLLSHTRFMRFHGTQYVLAYSPRRISRSHASRVARDFVEAPSQMLESWCWEPQVLAMMSSHHETGAPLSDELIKRIVKRSAL
jgi:Zn-dependent oligopeptidase